MATETSDPTLQRLSAEDIGSTTTTIKRMLVVGGLFVAVGYLLVLGALVVEVTQFHPRVREFFATQTAHSIAGGGPDRAGAAGLNSQLASIHRFPSTLLWLKLGGIAHVLVGIFVALGAIVRALSLMPHRLRHELEG